MTDTTDTIYLSAEEKERFSAWMKEQREKLEEQAKEKSPLSPIQSQYATALYITASWLQNYDK